MYDCMLAKNECDLMWTMIHGAIFHGCTFSESHNFNDFT